MAKESKLYIDFVDYTDVSELSSEVQELLRKAKASSESAYAPYSNFKVGASILMEDGTYVNGNNQENRAFPSGLCAERVAVFYASAIKPNMPMQAMAVFADIEEQLSPCGSCRQAILEYEVKQARPIEIYLINAKEEIRMFKSASDLLPFGFKFNNFNNK